MPNHIAGTMWLLAKGECLQTVEGQLIEGPKPIRVTHHGTDTEVPPHHIFAVQLGAVFTFLGPSENFAEADFTCPKPPDSVPLSS